MMRVIHTLLETGKRGRRDNDTHKRKRALPQGAKDKVAKRIKKVKHQLRSYGEELKQFNAALSSIQPKIIEIRMGLRLVLQRMARQEEIMVDILDAIEEGDSVKVNDLVQILFST
ncbi:hypothetical protein SLEP1_g34166 [Rubroshorea leprosula]|uniref:Uncharacterized protein n=1 Tax=Rubroshorea leprosula TaxID=152421 RepID=A0AAV5KJ84_9ROSI|nr:hypothetical protein SLEP1_g34166 [Rubroshorea leprosula]